ncbi:MAG: aminotransferase class I/II-fold pyridoxal phosphate-dependent enzyme [Candidatus Aminicenantes bacterium]|nr:aminotransferase class I/II-fold pyridoxal phosphate-dependent enzyme [Candidatus Aminicenantes bacterium]
MHSLRISRRNFMGSLIASAAVLPLKDYPWIHPSIKSGKIRKRINWGYPEGACRLDSNENPLGPSPGALELMEKALSQAHRYTSDYQLLKELASFHEVSKDMILAGCGSTEFLRIAPWTFLRQGGELITALQAYKTLPREAEKIEVKIRWIKLNDQFAFDLDSMKKALTPKTKMIYLVNPNNPTGTALDFETIQKFCSSLPKDIILFIDEAYSHFHQDKKGRNGITLIKQGFNVIVSRTFSKAYGLAGMRLGYVIAKPSIIRELRVFGFRDMGINQAVFAGGLASLEDHKHLEKYKELVQEGREFYYQQFDSLGLEYIPSTTPFLMVKVNLTSKVARKKLADKHVFVRKGEDWQMPSYLRISIGFPEENKTCVETLQKVLNL